MTCSIVSPASKVESIPPTLAGLVEVSLVVQQLNHTLQMRKELACERKQLACESTTLHGGCIMATITLLEVITATTKNPFTGGERKVEKSFFLSSMLGYGGCLDTPASQEVFQVGWAHGNMHHWTFVYT